VGRQSIVLLSVLLVALLAGAGWLGYQAWNARQVSQETDHLAKVLALEPTSRVADVGAGSGAFSRELAANVVPKGHVFATEIEESAVSKIRADAARARLDNITAVQGAEDSTNLPAACCDAVFLRGVYHHVAKPEETNRSLADALRPHGRLAIIDFEPSWFLSTFFPVRGVPPNRGGHGVAPSIAISEMERAGLRLVERLDDWSRGRYCLVFEHAKPNPS
jgi:SAM-dependent methyltransferase